jgi:TRAP-type C4-dicarboxylate transport system substrate-binding protein
MNKIYFAMASVCLLMLLVFSGSAAAQKSIELSFNEFLPSSNKHAIANVAWAKEIEKRTGGKVKITVYPGATLTAPEKVYGAVVAGICDMGHSILSYTRGRFPLMAAVDLPVGTPSGKVATLMARDFYKKFMPKELADTKVLILHGTTSPLIHTSKKQVLTLEDLKGLKIRTTGLTANIIKALGAIPVAMPYTETYEALQRGIVDGTYSSMETLKTSRLAEVVKYTTDTSVVGLTATGFIAMNLTRWNSLPKDIQKTVEEVSREYETIHGRLWDETAEEGRSFTLSRGNSVVALSKQEGPRWKDRTKVVLSDFVKETEAKRLPGKEALAEVIRLVEKYSK